VYTIDEYNGYVFMYLTFIALQHRYQDGTHGFAIRKYLHHGAGVGAMVWSSKHLVKLVKNVVKELKHQKLSASMEEHLVIELVEQCR
jgi:hypothetical protein